MKSFLFSNNPQKMLKSAANIHLIYDYSYIIIVSIDGSVVLMDRIIAYITFASEWVKKFTDQDAKISADEIKERLSKEFIQAFKFISPYGNLYFRLPNEVTKESKEQYLLKTRHNEDDDTYEVILLKPQLGIFITFGGDDLITVKTTVSGDGDKVINEIVALKKQDGYTPEELAEGLVDSMEEVDKYHNVKEILL